MNTHTREEEKKNQSNEKEREKDNEKKEVDNKWVKKNSNRQMTCNIKQIKANWNANRTRKIKREKKNSQRVRLTELRQEHDGKNISWNCELSVYCVYVCTVHICAVYIWHFSFDYSLRVLSPGLPIDRHIMLTQNEEEAGEKKNLRKLLFAYINMLSCWMCVCVYCL